MAVSETIIRGPVEQALQNWSPAYVGSIVVNMPPNWKRSDPAPYTVVIVDENISDECYRRFYRLMSTQTIVNPRIVTPAMLEYASLFHPSLFYALTHPSQTGHPDLANQLVHTRRLGVAPRFRTHSTVSPTQFWLQSLVFLSGVTLSAAIVQNRWSKGTLESKLNRLWQVGTSARNADIEDVNSLNIEQYVLQIAEKLDSNPVDLLIDLKRMYAKVLDRLLPKKETSSITMGPGNLTTSQQKRFGFVNDLRSRLGRNLQAVVLYGSAVNSHSFADYDLILVVGDTTDALNRLAGVSPKYNGLELNISIYNTSDFWNFQLASGDNLADHAICLFGKIDVPYKPLRNLMARNFSFGFVRQRQLVGMAACTAVQNQLNTRDDKYNLYSYCIKIPLNVGKGIEGTIGEGKSNEQIKRWASNEIGYNMELQRDRLRTGRPSDAIATAAWATEKVMQHHDRKLGIHVHA